MMSTARREPQPSKLLLYYITDRNQFPGGAHEKEIRLLEKIAEAASAAVDFIQLREKDLAGRTLEALARKALDAIPAGSETKLLINARLDVALASGAHGVHLPAHDLSPSEVRMVWDRASRTTPVVAVAVHSLEEVALAEAHGADFVVYGPVFEKGGHANPQGLEQLRLACHRLDRPAAAMPILALGGVTLENARWCLDAGASGFAGIRLFQQNAVEPLVEQLRAMLG